MNAQLKEPVETEEERLYRLYESPEARQHFREKYPKGCWDEDPRGDELPYDPD